LKFLEKDEESSGPFPEKKTKKGRKKIFEVRKIHNDVSFIDSFFDEDFCHKTKMFIYENDPKSGKKKITSRDFKEIKLNLLRSITNGGSPIIKIVDSNFNNKKELLLKHSFDGQELNKDISLATLKRLYYFWKRPVHIETVVNEVSKVLSFDGKDTSVNKL